LKQKSLQIVTRQMILELFIKNQVGL